MELTCTLWSTMTILLSFFFLSFFLYICILRVFAHSCKHTHTPHCDPMLWGLNNWGQFSWLMDSQLNYAKKNNISLFY
ncbi:hypothetical protein NHX12_008763 [Muraenolepis orangiensis]|uniref:Uncharacterized protein n=1 Tax=Muraenolepis orangiensis TaxID=630683 RepID=A0A9Q0IA46_9TELE|nr:hypothetical protein NHX12_008763 [Muraenolepis orangiensis]